MSGVEHETEAEMASENGTKTFSISIDVNVPADMSPESMAERVQSLVGEKASADAAFSKLTIRTISHDKAGLAAGYDNRLWERATC